MARFFINRPIFAWVIAICIMLVGLFSVNTLPVSQYPTIAPPSVSISANYPGADAQTVERSVTQIIEQNMTGLDGFMYMSATSDSYGSAEIDITFEPGTNPDIAQVQVQNKMQQTQSQLPSIVQQNGIDVSKSTDSFLLVASLVVNDGEHKSADCFDRLYLYTISFGAMTLPRRNPGTKVFENVPSTIVLSGAIVAIRGWCSPSKRISL